MSRKLLAVLAAAALALALTGAALSRTASTPTLKGTVGPGYTISLKRNGTRVKSLKAGSYKFVISDKASIHSYVVEKESGKQKEYDLTSTAFVGKKSKTIKLVPGQWKYYCKVHESTMHGFFKVK